MKPIASLLFFLAVLSSQSIAGLITDPLSASTLPPPPQRPVPTSPVQAAVAQADYALATQRLSQLLGAQTGGQALPLSVLMQDPVLFRALHAQGPKADELRGYMDWLLLTGLVVNFDGIDGSDDLYAGGGDDEVNADSSKGIILGGPGSDTLTPFNPSIILGGPGGDTLTPFNPSIILGGPCNDNIKPTAGQPLSLAGDSQDHNPDIADD